MNDPGKTDAQPGLVWRRVADGLSRRIDGMTDGEVLPAIAALQKEYNASRNAVLRAIRHLESRGLVSAGSGRRTRVTRGSASIVTVLSTEAGAGPAMASFIQGSASRVAPDKSRVSVGIEEPSEVVRRALDLAADAWVIRRSQEFRIKGEPLQLQTSFYPEGRFGALAGLRQKEDFESGVVSYLGKELGIEEVGWTDIYEVRVPHQSEGDFFHLPDDGRVKVFDWIRIGYDQDGTPFRVTITTCAANRNVFVQHHHEVPEQYLSVDWTAIL